MIRKIGPTVAGTWYPGDAQGLRSQLDALLAQAARSRPGPRPDRRVVALIAPHAGFVYSGRVAAHGFLEAQDRSCRRVLLIGPSHYSAFEDAVVPPAAVYRTPLGDVPLDEVALEQVCTSTHVRRAAEPFEREHSLEAEIPFLQRCLPEGWQLVPVLIGMLSRDSGGKPVADVLRPLVEPDTLVVVSSDFTHFGPRFDYVPFRADVPARVEQLDRSAVERILAWDLQGFEAFVRRTRATICGRNAIRVLLDLFGDGPAGELAAYDTSGRMTGDWENSVSYASLVFRDRAS